MSYFVYFLISSVLFLIVPIISIFNKKLKSRNLIEKSQYKTALKIVKSNHKKVIWIHAASGGEFEQIIPILEKVDRQNYFVLLSFMSPTIFNLQYNTKLADAVVYHPLDFYWKAKRFFSDFQPNFYILNRHDIWPNHIKLAKSMGVKIAIINLNIHLKSARYFWLFKNFNKLIFNYFDKIYTGSPRLKSSISNFVSEDKIQISGDTRFNRVVKRKEKVNQNLLPQRFKNTKNIILGSIIESDFDVVFNGIKSKFPNGESDLIQNNNGLIITPHEVDKNTISIIEGKLNENKIKYKKYSQFLNNKTEFNCSTIIIDTVGILADLYQYARVSYVGAGFGAGVHNVLEPAVYGCAVSFGPNIHILDEAIELHEIGLGTMAHSSNDFKVFLDSIDSNEMYLETKTKLAAFVKKHTCNIELLLDDILNEK